MVHVLWSIPAITGIASCSLGASLRYRAVNYDAFNTQRYNGMRICPISFVWLDHWDFNYEATLGFIVDKIVAIYSLNYFDQWKDPVYGRYMYLITTLVTMSVDPQDLTMTDWDAFYEYVMPSVQGCPVAMVRQAIVNSAIEFCEKSLIWIQDSIKNDVLENKPFYTYSPPPFAKVVMPYKVTLNGLELEPWDISKLESFNKNWKDIREEFPKRYVQVLDDTIRLVGVPTKSIAITDEDTVDENGNKVEGPSGLMADVVLKPTRQSRTCPTFLVTDWAETIAAGALQRLHSQIGKVWAKVELVSRYEKIFKEGISRAKSKHDKSYQRESNEMRPVRYYGGRAYYN